MINKDDYDSYDGYVDALIEKIAALKSELARMPVCVGYASRQEFENLNQYINRVTVREPTLIFCHGIYIDPPAIAQEKGDE